VTDEELAKLLSALKAARRRGPVAAGRKEPKLAVRVLDGINHPFGFPGDDD